MNEETNLPKASITRKPAVAGSFYPSGKEELGSQISSLINQSEKISTGGRIKILIVPHAGIVFSGPIAAAGFKQIENQNYSRVIILGASHRSWFDHAAVSDKGSWETPLGKVAIDEKLATVIIDEKAKILTDASAHNEEHSLEIELIFLQKVLNNFKIVPILLGQTSDQLIDDLAQKIAQNLDEQTLLVISTDLSHYPPYETANQVDDQTVNAILSGKVKDFEKTIQQLEAKDYPGLETAACGHNAIQVGMRVGEILKIKFQKIKYENSGDISSDKSRVVGYAAIAGFGGKVSVTNQLNEETKKEALEIAHQTLQEYLENKKIPIFTPKNSALQEPLGCFVTLRKNNELRGCIGKFEPKEPLYQVIQKMAVAAGTEDPRFPPVTVEELKNIKIEISVMTPKRKIKNWQEIELGKQGVVVQKGFQSGTFLPQVATETGWIKEEFLSQLCSQKAGLPLDCYKNPSVNLFVFEAQVFEEE